jgi:5-methylcytosine-specific restriction endonuclease McrA
VKICTKCGKEKLRDQFNKDTRSRDGLQWLCRPCGTARQVAYKVANPDKVRASSATWKAANPHLNSQNSALYRARKRNAVVSLISRTALEWLREQCSVYEALTGEPWAVDHIIPLARGGSHSEDNLRALPRRLNSVKGAKLDSEVSSTEFHAWINETGNSFELRITWEHS